MKDQNCSVGEITVVNQIQMLEEVSNIQMLVIGQKNLNMTNKEKKDKQ